MEFNKYEYICKAKTSISNEWVYGYYIEFNDRHYILTVESGLAVTPFRKPQSGQAALEVNKETICRCTGCKNEYDQYIFEKDIVENLYNERFVVIFSDGCWWIYGDSDDENRNPNLSKLHDVGFSRFKIVNNRIDYKGILNPYFKNVYRDIPIEYF